jgi:hypothetical protein
MARYRPSMTNVMRQISLAVDSSLTVIDRGTERPKYGTGRGQRAQDVARADKDKTRRVGSPKNNTHKWTRPRGERQVGVVRSHGVGKCLIIILSTHRYCIWMPRFSGARLPSVIFSARTRDQLCPEREEEHYRVVGGPLDR